MKCPACSSTNLRSSRIRFTDIPQLIVLRLPVRCRECDMRSHVPLSQGLKVRHDTELRHAEERLRKSNESPAPPL
jgi:hypothetical protein